MLVFGLPLLGIAVIASVIGVQQLQSVTDPMEKGVAGAVGSLIAGASLFLVRLRYRSVYGLTEVAVGLYLGWDKGAEVVGPLSVASSNRTFLLAMLTASIYLVVRGFDNMHVGWRARSGVAQRPGPSSKLSESTSMNTSTTPSKVLVALTRPPGYADVHPELVAIDALDPDRPWPHEVVRDEGADVVIELYRTEGYERAAARAVATEAVKPEWPAWRVVRS